MASEQSPPVGTAIFFVIAKTFETIGLAIKSATNVCLAYLAYLSIRELAGKSTTASLALTYITEKEHQVRLLPWIVTGTAVIWAYTERHLRLKKIAAMAHHNTELELRLDPSRSSSRLTAEGETAPGDKHL